VSAPEKLQYPVIPLIREDAAVNDRSYQAKPELMQALGYPGELPTDWKTKVLTSMKQQLEKSRALRVFMDSCVQCGACTDKCHYFLGGGDSNNMPVARQNLFRSVYRRYFTLAGRWFPWLVGARELTREVLDEWFNYFHQCSECRRCSVYCPVGIDTSEVTMAGREILSSVGIGQKNTQNVINKVNTIGNNLGMPTAALKDTLAGLEEDLLDETGIPIALPLDREDAEILLVVPSADFFAEPHVEGLLGCVKVLHASGLSWTFSSVASEAANFGLFSGSHEQMKNIAERIREAAQQLKVKRIVFGECGHAWRVAYNYLHKLAGPFDFLDQNHPIPQHILEVTVDLIRNKKIILDKSKNDAYVVTYHDSWKLAVSLKFPERCCAAFVTAFMKCHGAVLTRRPFVVVPVVDC